MTFSTYAIYKLHHYFLSSLLYKLRRKWIVKNAHEFEYPTYARKRYNNFPTANITSSMNYQQFLRGECWGKSAQNTRPYIIALLVFRLTELRIKD